MNNEVGAISILVWKLNALDQKISMLDSRIESIINILRTMINDTRIIYQLECKILAQTAIPASQVERKEQVVEPPPAVPRQPSPTEFWNIGDTLERQETVFPGLLGQSWPQTQTHQSNTLPRTQ